MDGTELIELADRLDQLKAEFHRKHKPKIERMTEAAEAVQKAWSGSQIGYHARVYYENLKPVPPGARFSAMWGMKDALSNDTRGNWAEFDHDGVVQHILTKARATDQAAIGRDAAALEKEVERARQEVLSALTVALSRGTDTYLERLKTKIEKPGLYDASTFATALIKGGQVMSSDYTALNQGVQIAPHQQVIATAVAFNAAAEEAGALADEARQAGSHLVRLSKRERKSQMVGTNVFIGHGRSREWRVLKDFVSDRLGLPWDEFNRVPVAGVTNIARLAEMLDSAAIALLVLTAEDEQVDGRMQARQNVIHEVGLFQGRLGFTKAIVLLEEGCEEFSNIQGLGQIRFPGGRIDAAFEDIRRVLEREGLIEELV